MRRWIDKIVTVSLQKNYITEEQAPWLHYALEKRTTILLVAVPFCLLGCSLSPISTTTAFLFSFYFLRERTSGLHTSSVWVCLITSLVLEFLFLGILPRVMSREYTSAFALLSVGYIFIFAPFRCSYIQFTDEEANASAVGVKIRTAVLFVIWFLLSRAGFLQAADGITYGILMTAFSLALAYIKPKERTK